jgi:hypothetical protein
VTGVPAGTPAVGTCIDGEPVSGAVGGVWWMRCRMVAAVLTGVVLVVGPVAAFGRPGGDTSVSAFQVCPNPTSGCTASNHNQVLP